MELALYHRHDLKRDKKEKYSRKITASCLTVVLTLGGLTNKQINTAYHIRKNAPTLDTLS